MKKIILFIVVCLFVSCDFLKTNEQLEMEEKLTEVVDSYAFANFKVYKQKHLKSEIDEQLKLHNYYLNWHKSGVEAFADAVNDTNQIKSKAYNEERLRYHQQAMVKDCLMINYLNDMLSHYPEDDIIFTTYEMSYLFDGTKLDICFGKFNKEKDLIAFKPSADMDWVFYGDTTVIVNKYNTKL